MATKTAVTVKMRGRPTKKNPAGKVRQVTFHKAGTEESLCKPTMIKIHGKTFKGRRGGRALCGGEISADASEARGVFARCAKKAKGDHSEMKACIHRNYRLEK